VNTPIGRDFKRSQKRGSFEFNFGKEFWTGLIIGLTFAATGLIFQQRNIDADLRIARDGLNPTDSLRVKGIGNDAALEPLEDTPQKLDFYDRLKTLEVVIPEIENNAQRDLPNNPVDRPGSYVLQPGNYAKEADAERLRVQLQRLGVEATVQRVAVDTNVYHRVRIGPMTDLKVLNSIRAKLNAVQIQPVLIRLDD